MIVQPPKKLFRPAPSPELYIATPTHTSVLAQITHSADAGYCITALAGAAGVGKTMLALKHLSSGYSSTTPIFLAHSRFDRPGDFYQAILFDFERPSASLSENELRLAVQEALLSTSGKRSIIALDDADSMSDAVLDELRFLGNLAVGGSAVASLLLVGSPALATRLKASSVADRIGPICTLAALSAKESESFLRDQLQTAGCAEESFSDEAISLIASHGQGIARSLNRLAATALSIATEAGEESVDVEAVLEALDRLSPPEESAHLPLTAESAAGRAGSSGSRHDSQSGRTPKQKARKRKAA